MPFYRCVILGENFPLRVDGQEELHGFYTTRWVQALDEKRAELKAVEMVRRELRPHLPPDHPLARKARMCLDNIGRVGSLPRFRGGGFAWFAMDDGEGRAKTREIENSI
jgi:hypothetical protein